MKLPAAEIPKFRRSLLRWFRRQKRDLPWRRTKDPYCIWLSEIMLQQTRVGTVVPYYRGFLKSFPTIQALARARTEQVLRHWAGLGYYNRVRHLHRAAKEIVARHNGCFPRELEAALRLPGIGRYTAAAVLSIAYGSPHAVLDGNVERVLARLWARRGDIHAPRRWTQLQTAAQSLLSPENPGDWNQAMMELGATVCTPRKPRCGACPVSGWCRAYALGIAEALPAARRKRVVVKVNIAAVVLLDRRGRTLVIKDSDRHEGALFSRMWQFPAVAVARHAQAKLGRHLRDSFGLQRARLTPLDAVRHSVTFREITLVPFLARVDRLPHAESSRRPLLANLNRLPVSSATSKMAAAAQRHLETEMRGNA